MLSPADIEKRAFELAELEERGYGCRTFLYRQINDGRLRAVKRGRRTIVLAEDLASWVSGLPDYKPRAGVSPNRARSARRT
jgi:hypothetical protein